MSVSQTRIWSAVALSILLAAGVLVAFLPYFFASAEMKSFCAELPVGMPVSAVQERGEAVGYELAQMADGRLALHDPRSFGRLQCVVAFVDDRLARAEFSSGD